jgi:hypothetical protein
VDLMGNVLIYPNGWVPRRKRAANKSSRSR